MVPLNLYMSSCHSCINKQQASTKRDCFYEKTQQSTHCVWVRCLSRVRPDPLPIKSRDENHREENKHTGVSKLWWSHVLSELSRRDTTYICLPSRRKCSLCQRSKAVVSCQSSLNLPNQQKAKHCSKPTAARNGLLCLEGSSREPPSSSSLGRLVLKGRHKG